MTAPLFAGNQLSDFLTHPSATEVTTVNHFDPSWVPNAIHIPSTTTPLKTPVFAQQTTLWIHWEDWLSASNSTLEPWMIAYDNAGTAKVRLLATGSSPVATSLQYWTGAAWSTIANFSVTAGAKHQHDTKIVINGAASEITHYVDQVEVATGTGDYSSVGNIAQAGFACHQLNGSCDISQAIVHTVSTLKRKYNLRLVNGDGTHADFTGNSTAVDEAILDNTDFISTTTANAISTFTQAGKDLTGYGIDCVIPSHVSSRDDGTGPQNSRWCLRIGGNDYFQAADQLLAVGFGGFSEYLTTNPATGAAWTAAAAGSAAMEVGVKALA